MCSIFVSKSKQVKVRMLNNTFLANSPIISLNGNPPLRKSLNLISVILISRFPNLIQIFRFLTTKIIQIRKTPSNNPNKNLSVTASHLWEIRSSSYVQNILNAMNASKHFDMQKLSHINTFRKLKVTNVFGSHLNYTRRIFCDERILIKWEIRLSLLTIVLVLKILQPGTAVQTVVRLPMLGGL